MTRPDHAADVRGSLVDPARVAEMLGLKIGRQRQRGGVFVGCPWHGEKTPSCSITVGDDGTLRAHCFGCKETGDVLSLIAAVNGYDLRADFPRILEEGARLAGIRLEDDVDHGGARARLTRPKPSPPPAIEPARLAAVLAPLLAIGRLDGSPMVREVEAYLDRRGLLSAARADGWAALPPRGPAQAALGRVLTDNFEASDLLACGIMRRNPGGGLALSWAEHRLVIPWRGPDGAVSHYQRRLIGPGAGDAPKYIGPTSIKAPWPYGVEALSRAPASAPIAFVEGAVDVVALQALDGLEAPAGEERVILGVPGSGWCLEWAELARGRVVYIASDADAWDEKKNQPGAGDLAAEIWARDVHSRGAARVLRLRPEGAKDWGEVLEGRVRDARRWRAA
ncbi:MAG: CHC2 zinc finger domain-containing protein [Polyangiaceae bacterium]|nr:CHC2 zinc finger domain-containing protein [Polyangiaceae bacterium]